MGRRGPRPTPTHVLKLVGSRVAGRRTNEVQPDPTPPKCPAWLPKAAKQKWRALAPELVRLGLLTSVDGDTFAAYCVAFAEMVQATETLERDGRFLLVGGQPVTIPATETEPERTEWRGGQLQPHPAVAQQRSAWTAMKSFAALFGLSPSGRVGLPSSVQESEPTTGVPPRDRGGKARPQADGDDWGEDDGAE